MPEQPQKWTVVIKHGIEKQDLEVLVNEPTDRELKDAAALRLGTRQFIIQRYVRGWASEQR